MTLSFAFSQMYHPRNRAAKHDGTGLWFDAPDAERAGGRTGRISAIALNRAGSCRI
jgi:hypothetical protein